MCRVCLFRVSSSILFLRNIVTYVVRGAASSQRKARARNQNARPNICMFRVLLSVCLRFRPCIAWTAEWPAGELVGFHYSFAQHRLLARLDGSIDLNWHADHITCGPASKNECIRPPCPHHYFARTYLEHNSTMSQLLEALLFNSDQARGSRPESAEPTSAKARQSKKQTVGAR